MRISVGEGQCPSRFLPITELLFMHIHPTNLSP